MTATVPTGAPARPTQRLRDLLEAQELLYLMEAHDGLSARIAEVEGFAAIWASGFAVSTALGVRDSDEATWSQMLGVVECMTEAVTSPIVVDGDTGYGNFNTARRFARRAERLGVAGICLEDKRFPKMNSFVGHAHELVAVAEFADKVQACKDSQGDGDFCVIARTEALIAGYSVGEALERANAYVDAGADAIFIHSRLAVFDQVQQFARGWDGRRPLVIAPTTYAATPAEVFRESGISAVIWANHSMRAAVAAMRRVCREIKRHESTSAIDVAMAPLDEVFELMRYRELEFDQRRYRGAPR
jgi:phosphoenolpyruvate phosphomutase